MTFAFESFGSQAREDEAVPSQAEIEREIEKLAEDSARDVQRQLAQQRSAAREAQAEERVKNVVEGVEERIEPAWKAAEREVAAVIEDAEADVKGVRRHIESVPRVSRASLNGSRGAD